MLQGARDEILILGCENVLENAHDSLLFHLIVKVCQRTLAMDERFFATT